MQICPSCHLAGALLSPCTGVSPHICSSAYCLTEVFLTLDVGYLLMAAAPDLGPGVSPLGRWPLQRHAARGKCFASWHSVWKNGKCVGWSTFSYIDLHHSFIFNSLLTPNLRFLWKDCPTPSSLASLPMFSRLWLSFFYFTS